MSRTNKKRKRVCVIGAQVKPASEEDLLDALHELKSLCYTADLLVKGLFYQKIDEINPSTFLGKGKLGEIAKKAKQEQIDALVFNENLSASQIKNIEKLTHFTVINRTELILEIFYRHAKTKQAKIQVELARKEYNYSRLKSLWTHLSRIQGGIGFKGPGEKQIELDRREFQRQITKLKEELKKIIKTTKIKRNKRKNFTQISLVGYTNAGKSTIFNRLTKARKYTADKLFATLDSTSKKLDPQLFENKVIISDTVGFIKNIPHTLISSFHSTLLEVQEAELLLHVVDISHKNCEEMINNVEKVLREIEVEDKMNLLIFNKIDKLEESNRKAIIKHYHLIYPNAVFISAKNKENWNQLIDKINQFLENKTSERIVRIPDNLVKLIEYVHKNTEIIEESFDNKNTEWIIKTKISNEMFKNIKHQIDKFNLMKYINN